MLDLPVPAAARADAHESALLRAAAVDEHALRDLYRRYERSLYGFGLRALGERGLAEELVQETFVRLWQSAPRFDPARGSARSLIFGIARRVAVDLHRRPSSRPFAGSFGEGATIEAPADHVLLAVTVRDAMMSLSDTHREVLELVYEQDLKLADVAERTGAPLGTVKTRAYHALRSLRAALQERGWDG